MKLCILTILISLFCVGLASASVPYWVDSSGNTFIKVNLNGQTQTLGVNTTSGDGPNGDEVFLAFDNFSGSSLDASKWSGYLYGGATTQTVSNSLALAGLLNTYSSSGVVNSYTWKNGTELVLHEKVSDTNYTDTGFGDGTPHAVANTDNTSFYHTGLSNGVLWQEQNQASSYYVRTTVNPTTSLDASTTWFGTGKFTQYGSVNSNYTQAVGYDANGTAYLDWVNVVPTSSNLDKLYIPTYDSSNQPVHPSVVDFGTPHWGYRYWMAMTPYTGGSDAVENPSILASQDGFSWTKPSWITNPIESYPGAGWHLDDPDLIYNAAQDRLECYYMYTNNANQTLTPNQQFNNSFAVRYINGTAVSGKYNITGGGNPYGWDTSGTYFGSNGGWCIQSPVSPSFVVDSNGDYWAYVTESNVTGVSTYVNGQRPVYLYHSVGGNSNFTFVKQMTLNEVAGVSPWHLDAERLSDGSVNYLIDYSSGTSRILYYGHGDSVTGNITVQETPILSPTASTWYDYRVYRACSVTRADGSMDVWFSGATTLNVWGIGFMHVENVSGTWQPVTLHNIPRARIAQYTNSSFLTNDKHWIISKGAATSSRGGTRTIYSAYVRPIGHDPTVSIQQSGSGYLVTITPIDSETVNDYVVELPAYDLTATNSMLIDSPSIAGFTQSKIQNTQYQFIDSSTGNPISFYWDFGDGSTSTEQNPAHSYATEGSYEVTETVTDAFGSYEITQFVRVTNSFTDVKTANGQNTTANYGLMQMVLFVLGAVLILGGLQSGQMSIKTAVLFATAIILIGVVLQIGASLCNMISV